ncbi:unnamed protein product [Heterobilharzia americana]|nr:unnamed protein product [Heterobilharzia americana]
MRTLGRDRMLAGVGKENLFNLSINKLSPPYLTSSSQIFVPCSYKNSPLNKPYNESIYSSVYFKNLTKHPRISGDKILTKIRL